MANGILLVAPERFMQDFCSIVEEHGIHCHLEVENDSLNGKRLVSSVSFICQTQSARVIVGVEKHKHRSCVDVMLVPKHRSFFRRHRESDALAERIRQILCGNGAANDPFAGCDDRE